MHILLIINYRSYIMSIIANSFSKFFGGSITVHRDREGPSNRFLERQLANRGDTVVEISGTRILVWDDAYVDLKRHGTFKINNVTVYSLQGDTSSPALAIPSPDIICAKILTATNDDFAETLQYTKLQEQLSYHIAHSEVFLSKGIATTKLFKVIEKSAHLEVGQVAFRVSLEIVGKIKDANDIEESDPKKYPCTYIKVKNVISGTRNALITSRDEAMNMTIFYTPEFKSESEARNASFPTK